LHLTTSPEREEIKEKRRRGEDAEMRKRADAKKEESKFIGSE
jgi:hypothetical protein